jgi:hypothetical protein
MSMSATPSPPSSNDQVTLGQATMQHLPEAEEFPHQMNPHRTLSMSQWMLGQSFTAIDICTGITERVDLMSIVHPGRESKPAF